MRGFHDWRRRFEAKHWRSRDSHGSLEWGSCNICVHGDVLCNTIHNLPNPKGTQPVQRLQTRYKLKPQGRQAHEIDQKGVSK